MIISIIFVVLLAISLSVAFRLNRSSARRVFLLFSVLFVVAGSTAFASHELGKVALPIAVMALNAVCLFLGPAAFARVNRNGVAAAIAVSSIACLLSALATIYAALAWACDYGEGCV